MLKVATTLGCITKALNEQDFYSLWKYIQLDVTHISTNLSTAVFSANKAMQQLLNSWYDKYWPFLTQSLLKESLGITQA